MSFGVLTVLVAAAPSLFLLTFFYLKDRYEREPLLHLCMAFGLGLYSMIAAQGMATTAEGWISADWLSGGSEPARLVDAFVLSGFVEELAKWVVLIMAIYHWDEFDEPLDGVVYGVAVALGFATLENLLFVLRLGLGVAWQRALFAVPAHALFGATMGYYAGRAKFARGRALWLDRGLCLGAPTVFTASTTTRFTMASGRGSGSSSRWARPRCGSSSCGASGGPRTSLLFDPLAAEAW